MTSHQILVLVLIQLLILLLPAFGLSIMFEKANVPGWKAFVPFYNTWVMLDLAKRPKHWVYWQFIPIVGWFISMGIYIEFVKTFGKFKFYEHALAALLPVFIFLIWDSIKQIVLSALKEQRNIKNPFPANGWMRQCLQSLRPRLSGLLFLKLM